MPKKSLLFLLLLVTMLNLCGCGRENNANPGGSAAKNEVTDETMGFVNADVLKVRREPSADAEIVALLQKEQKVSILAEQDEFYQVLIQAGEGAEEPDTVLEGYVKKEYINVE